MTSDTSHRFPGGARLSRKNAAEYLGVAEETLARWASVGHPNIPYYRVGHKAVYLQGDLDKFLAHRRITSEPDT